MQDIANRLKNTGDTLFNKKSEWDELCQEIAEHFHPLRADFTTSFNLGTDFQTDLMESTGVQARETLGNAPNAMLRQGNWFRAHTGIETIDDVPTNEKWLEKATKRFRQALYDRRANFVGATIEADHDWVTFGNPVLCVQTDSGREHLIFKAYHPRDCAWMENERGEVDHLHRKAPMTARAIMKRYPKTAHDTVKQLATEDGSKHVQVRQVVLPVDELNYDKDDRRKKFGDNEFASIYIDCDNSVVLSESGLKRFNFVVPRARRAGRFPQGFSPMTVVALPDSRSLQVVTETLLETGEKAVDTPILGNANVFRDNLNFYAGGFTSVDLGEGTKLSDQVMQLPPSGDFNVGLRMQEDYRRMIHEAFLLNKLFLPNVREMTAFETAQRMEEFRRAALPFFGPIEAEYHSPLLDVSFDMALELGIFKDLISEMPDELQDVDVIFDFESPLREVDGAKNLAAFKEGLQITAAAAQVDQSVTKSIDWSKAYDDAMRGAGAKAEWFSDEDQVQDDKQADKALQAIEQAAVLANSGAQVTQNVAEAEMAAQEAGLNAA
ncbi:hypothetical protein MXMO3_01704 [Maritalea myrionectae]|uniref:Bacteriophage head to tail connecting protein n=1 Tax=Maritalea myrionectae TaxID=454601 RepID=A0A2R4MDZ6_9HYPH|nr:portal protein [Maritalea myrionectae]AVX04230.1 hypothetical protein MXMO3_01704 [Maritalea myrionectae]